MESSIDGADLERRWTTLQTWLRPRFGQEVGVDGLLFLIGLHLQGRSFEPDLPKEKKQDLIMEGSYGALATLGYYEQVGMETGGAWIWAPLRPLPELGVDDQENLLRLGIVHYFEALI